MPGPTPHVTPPDPFSSGDSLVPFPLPLALFFFWIQQHGGGQRGGGARRFAHGGWGKRRGGGLVAARLRWRGCNGAPLRPSSASSGGAARGGEAALGNHKFIYNISLNIRRLFDFLTSGQLGLRRSTFSSPPFRMDLLLRTYFTRCIAEMSLSDVDWKELRCLWLLG